MRNYPIHSVSRHILTYHIEEIIGTLLLFMGQYTTLFISWTSVKMKNGISVQESCLVYFDNRNRLVSQVGYLGKDTPIPGLGKFIHQFPLFQDSSPPIYDKNNFPPKIACLWKSTYLYLDFGEF